MHIGTCYSLIYIFIRLIVIRIDYMSYTSCVHIHLKVKYECEVSGYIHTYTYILKLLFGVSGIVLSRVLLSNVM